MDSFKKIDNVIKRHLKELRKPNVLTVRPGYKFTGGWITNKLAIVAIVNGKTDKMPVKSQVPPKVEGIATDVRETTTMEKIRYKDPERYASLMIAGRPEFRHPVFPFERDARTGKLLEGAEPYPSIRAGRQKPQLEYTIPQGYTLKPIKDKFSLICHASPDAGWPQLSEFLNVVKNKLTVGMYDFTSGHILKAFLTDFGNQKSLSLVLDHPALDQTADQSDEQTEAALKAKLGQRENFAWALERNDPMISEWIFPSAYHIKVAVRDEEAFWLSSGNFNNSNQPDIDPIKDPNGSATTAKKSDRDWHVIVNHPGLAKTFEAYLQNDLAIAKKYQSQSLIARRNALPKKITGKSPEKAKTPGIVPIQYFAPMEINNELMTIHPLLTPDKGDGNYVDNILQLIESADRSLYMQTQYVHVPQEGVDQPLWSLINAVKDKMHAGKDVRIILSEYEATKSYLELLQGAGWDMSAVRIQKGVHNKGIVVDSKIVALGSQNWSGDGVIRNRDASLIIEHQGAAQYFEEIFVHDWVNMASQSVDEK